MTGADDSWRVARRRDIEAALDRALTLKTLRPELIDSMRYATLGGGKKLRPLLVCATAEALGAEPGPALPAACAVEMIHAYSLVHDDLPAMDNADTRHGKASCHSAFGHAEAILAGDGLQPLAFETIAGDQALTERQRLAMVVCLAKAAGPLGMVGGQSADMAAEGELLDQPSLEALHRQKTGALLTACLELGGLVADADASTLSHLRSAGTAMGLAFQVIDDVLDQTASADTMGKPVRADNDKNTYPKLMGLEAARAYAQELLATARQALSHIGIHEGPLTALVDSAVHRER